MNLKTLTQLFLTFSLMVICTSAFAQGTTTASLSGTIVDDKNEPVIGASVIATHVPTGTRYGTITDVDGNYLIPNTRVGGPFSLDVSYIGFAELKEENIYLKLGQVYRKNFAMSESAIVLSTAVVSSSRAADRTGAGTTIDEDMINNLPTVSRSIGDFARLTPQASVREGNDGFSISLNGVNNRYNAIYIDGAVNNDVFGLAGSGTNGGQTGVSPISVDAVESFQIALASFDVRLGGFSGGAINAVTRSGSNNTEASVYAFTRNEKLAGLTPTDNADVERERLEDFVGLTTGFRIGGALVKDKLFYFLNAEMQRDETPLPFNLADYDGDSDQATLDAIGDKLRGLGYEPGGYVNNRSFLDSDKITARFDYNISQDHKASLRYGYVNARNLENLQSNNRTINFQNRAEYFENTTNNVALSCHSL